MNHTYEGDAMSDQPDELSVLDYFAAAALTGYLALSDEDHPQTRAQRAYNNAKFMMLERAKRDKDGNKLEDNV